jgi:hypothetical protein
VCMGCSIEDIPTPVGNGCFVTALQIKNTDHPHGCGEMFTKIPFWGTFSSRRLAYHHNSHLAGVVSIDTGVGEPS